MYLNTALWLLAATTHVAHSLHIQNAFHPILLEAGTRTPNIMDEIILNLTSSTPPWLGALPPALDRRALSTRDDGLPVSQQRNPPNGRSYPGVQWDETCSDEQITIILQALGDAHIMAEAAQKTMEELQTVFIDTTNSHSTDPGLKDIQKDVILRIAPMIRKFFAREGPGVGYQWSRIVARQLENWKKITATMDKPDNPDRIGSPERILRLACNLGGTNPDGSEADDIQNGNNKNLCHDPSKPDEDSQALYFQVDVAHNDKRTYKGINAGVINFCRAFFFFPGTNTRRASNFQKEQDFQAQPAGQKKMTLKDLDTTGRILLHEITHVSWSLELPGGPTDKIGYEKMAAASGNGYSQTSRLPDAWAWSGVWARWMKFKDILTCDLYPADA